MKFYKVFVILLILILLLFWSLVLFKTLGVITSSAFDWADLNRYFNLDKEVEPIEYPDISEADFDCLENLCGDLGCYKDEVCLPILVECVHKNLEKCPRKTQENLE